MHIALLVLSDMKAIKSRSALQSCFLWSMCSQELSIGNIKFRAFDLGGHEIARKVWKEYYAKVRRSSSARRCSIRKDAWFLLQDRAEGTRDEPCAECVVVLCSLFNVLCTLYYAPCAMLHVVCNMLIVIFDIGVILEPPDVTVLV